MVSNAGCGVRAMGHSQSKVTAQQQDLELLTMITGKGFTVSH